MRQWWAALACWFGTVGLLWGQAPPTPRGEETVEVHLQIIPFYVVDESGQPVLDLKPEEVQVLVDGKPYPIGHLDRYTFVQEASGDSDRPEASGSDSSVEHQPLSDTAGKLRPGANPSRRHVLLLFDLAFSSPRGFRISREVSLQTCERILDSDLVYLLVFSGTKGLQRLWGPVSGRDRVCNRLQGSLGLRRGIERAPSPDVDFPSEEGRNVESNISISSELEDYVREAQTFNQWTYRDVAQRLAATLKQLAASLRPVQGPKLLIYFSQGVRNNVYFAAAYAEPVEQPIVPGQFPQLYGQDDRLGSSFVLHQDFEEAGRALAEAGVMVMVVNPEGYLTEASAPLSGENSLRHIARVTSGLYVEGTQEAHIRQQISQWTAAYYEAGIYLRNREYKGKFHKVEVRLLRPGVRLWSLRGFRDPRPYRDFTPEERLSYAIQLIYRGVENLTARPAHARWLPLNGRPGGRISTEERLVWFDAEFQPEWKGKKLDIFSITFDGDSQGRVGSLRDSRAEQRKLLEGGTLRVENRLPWHGTFVWGIVVVEPDSGTTWWYRTLVHSPLEK